LARRGGQRPEDTPAKVAGPQAPSRHSRPPQGGGQRIIGSEQGTIWARFLTTRKPTTPTPTTRGSRCADTSITTGGRPDGDQAMPRTSDDPERGPSDGTDRLRRRCHLYRRRAGGSIGPPAAAEGLARQRSGPPQRGGPRSGRNTSLRNTLVISALLLAVLAATNTIMATWIGSGHCLWRASEGRRYYGTLTIPLQFPTS